MCFGLYMCKQYILNKILCQDAPYYVECLGEYAHVQIFICCMYSEHTGCDVCAVEAVTGEDVCIAGAVTYFVYRGDAF